MVQKSGEKTIWDGAKTLEIDGDRLPTSTGEPRISSINRMKDRLLLLKWQGSEAAQKDEMFKHV